MSSLRAARDDLRAAIPGWVLGHVLTALGWVGAIALVHFRSDGVETVQMHQGLFAWDAAYYRDIARVGYKAAGPDAGRFHPLLPMLGRTEVGLLVVCCVASLLAAAAVHRLVVEVLADGDLARRAATLVGIAPPAFTLVWGYTEGLLLLMSALCALAVHRRQWWWAAAFGALATLARPTGVLLMVPIFVAAFATRSDPPRHQRVARAAAVLAPGLVMAGWLWWVGRTYGDAWLPLRVQGELRGGVRFPPFRLLEGIGEMVLDPFGDGLHVPFAFAIVALAWVAWRRLPRAWAWYAVVAAVTILSAANLNSSERYAFGTVPLVIAGAAATGGRRWRPAAALSCCLLVGMTAFAWYGRYVP